MRVESRQEKYGSSQGIFSIWQGMDLPNWCRLLWGRPPLHWHKTLRLALVSGMSVSNSVFKIVEQLVYGGELKRYELKNPPVFILGHWRSGTTLLHELLFNDPRMICPNLYQILSPHHCLLTEPVVAPLTGWVLPKTRPMDNMRISWDAPQEDETALCNLTCLSPYMMLAYQGQRWKYERFFELQDLTPREKQRWTTAFTTFLKKVALRHEKKLGAPLPGQRLLLKSPTHTYRIKLMLELFPDAQFIHIVRNPYDVFNSAMHLHDRLFESNALGKPQHEGAEEDVCTMYDHLFQVFEADRHLVAPKQFHELKYEDLEQDPVGELEKIYDRFEFGDFEALRTKLDGQLDSHRQFRKNRFDMAEETKQRIYTRWQSVFEQYGYPSGLAGAPHVVSAPHLNRSRSTKQY